MPQPHITETMPQLERQWFFDWANDARNWRRDLMEYRQRGDAASRVIVSCCRSALDMAHDRMQAYSKVAATVLPA